MLRALARIVPLVRDWQDGDSIDDRPADAHDRRASAGWLPLVAILHGPILLAAKTGAERPQRPDAPATGAWRDVSSGPYLPLDAAPMLVGDDVGTLADPGPACCGPAADTSRHPDIVRPATERPLELTPFFRLHDSRYIVYWRAVNAAGVPGRGRAVEGAGAGARFELEGRTLDCVSPGSSNRRSITAVRSEGSTTGASQGRLWRDASGWFSYDIDTRGERRPLSLVVTYSGRRTRAQVRDPTRRPRHRRRRARRPRARSGSSMSPTRFLAICGGRHRRHAHGHVRGQAGVARRRCLRRAAGAQCDGSVMSSPLPRRGQTSPKAVDQHQLVHRRINPREEHRGHLGTR